MGLKSGQMLVKWELGKMGGCNGNLTHMVSSNVFVGAGGTIFFKVGTLTASTDPFLASHHVLYLDTVNYQCFSNIVEESTQRHALWQS
jgi:hypothetical protein